MKKYGYLIVIGLCLILVGCFLLFGEETIDPTSEFVTGLYNSLGPTDLSICGSLNTYSKEVKKEDIPLENRLCLAYSFLAKDEVTTEVIPASKEKDKNELLCKISDEIYLTPEENEKECSYNKVSKETLNASYKKIYGDDISNYLLFHPSFLETCFLKDDFYYCGLGETISGTILPNTTILRIINKALKNVHGDIIIEDYYLRIANGKCYNANGLGEENTKCSSALSEYEDFSKESDKVKKDFLKKYGQKYRHVFKENDNGEYYWYKSYQK